VDLVFGVVLILAGCGGDVGAPAFQVRDSAGIQIAESQRPAWEGDSGWLIGTEPALRLGVVDGDPALQFDRVTGVVRLGDGRVVVGDGGSQEIRIFDAAGDLITITGGSGEGPGEFTGLSEIGTGPGGRIWAYDFSLRRITWLNGSGEVEHLVSLGTQPPTLNSVGALSDGTFVLKQLWGAAQVSEARETGFRRDPVAFVRFDAEGVLADTLGLFPGRELFLTDENGRGVMNTPPIGRNSVGAVWGDGVVVGTQDAFELVRYGSGGEPNTIVRIPSWDLTLGPGELEGYIQGRLDDVPAERRPGLRQELESMPVPAHKPAYGGLLVDEAENLWVGEWTTFAQMPRRWTVLDRSGQWLGEMVMPERFFPYAIGEDWVLGVETDELDVEFVVLYPLIKGAKDSAEGATDIAKGTSADGGEPPNFVFFLIDDLGWRDLGSFGSTFHLTPNIDRLATSGMRFTQTYAASPVCSPTRASILTGRHPARLDITDWIGGSQRGELLPAEYVDHLLPEEVTLAEVLKGEGYATGYFGKWHLGNAPHLPESQGFDMNVGGTGAGQPASYFFPYKAEEGRNPFWDVPGLDGGEEGEYLTDRLTDEALAFLDERRDQPFLLYLAHFAVHTPIQSKEELVEGYAARRDSLPPVEGPLQESEHERARTRLVQDDPAYAGMVQSVDESVGRILDRLDDLGLAENTVVIFMSDNGGLSTLAGERVGPTTNSPLRAGKGWLYEGGIRTPMIIRWPGRAAAGTESDVPVQSTDFFPTMVEMVGASDVAAGPLDGLSLVPLLTGSSDLRRDAIFWHFPHYHGSGNRPSGAIRMGRWKLVEWFEDGTVELYDLEADPGEREDISETETEKVSELLARLRSWRSEVGAKMPRVDSGNRED